MDRRILKDLAVILIQVIKKGPENYITYGELSNRINHYIAPINLNKPLGELSDIAMDHGFPRISAIVVNQDTGIPGDGYFRYFAGGIRESKWMEFWEKDLELIYSCNDWDEFINFI